MLQPFTYLSYKHVKRRQMVSGMFVCAAICSKLYHIRPNLTSNLTSLTCRPWVDRGAPALWRKNWLPAVVLTELYYRGTQPNQRLDAGNRTNRSSTVNQSGIKSNVRPRCLQGGADGPESAHNLNLLHHLLICALSVVMILVYSESLCSGGIC